jgi:hypothetical protein
MQYNEPKPAASKKTGKRSADGCIKGYLVSGAGASGGTVATTSTLPAAAKKGRVMEYVNIPMLYTVLRGAMRQCSPSQSSSPHHELHFMRMFAFLIGMTGTDFTRNLPHLTPIKIWDALAIRGVWPALIRAYDVTKMELVPSDACDMFVARLYCIKFEKHAGGDTLEDVLASLQRSKLGDRVKGQLPSASRVQNTIRNINWVFKYWECLQPVKAPVPTTMEERETGDVWLYDHVYPDPVCAEYGFKMATNRSNAVQWADA